jgi:hypothetical protein
VACTVVSAGEIGVSEERRDGGSMEIGVVGDSFEFEAFKRSTSSIRRLTKSVAFFFLSTSPSSVWKCINKTKPKHSFFCSFFPLTSNTS